MARSRQNRNLKIQKTLSDEMKFFYEMKFFQMKLFMQCNLVLTYVTSSKTELCTSLTRLAYLILSFQFDSEAERFEIFSKSWHAFELQQFLFPQQFSFHISFLSIAVFFPQQFLFRLFFSNLDVRLFFLFNLARLERVINLIA